MRYALVLALAATLGSAACAAVQRTEASAAKALLPVSEEKKLGAQLSAQIEQQEKLDNDPDNRLITTVRGVGYVIRSDGRV
jgi:hypothetical protein